jgi:hypothetical protein
VSTCYQWHADINHTRAPQPLLGVFGGGSNEIAIPCGLIKKVILIGTNNRVAKINVEFLDSYYFTIIEFGIAGLAAVSVAGLACMHTWLIATMQTTNEDVSCCTELLYLMDSPFTD